MSAPALPFAYTPKKMTISTWAEADRPREKLLLKGRQHLSDAELLSILLGSGSSTENAVELAQRLLSSMDNSLHQLGRKSSGNLLSFHGIGEAKAARILAALELGRRHQQSPISDYIQLRTSSDAYRCLRPYLTDLSHEECWLLCLNQSNCITNRVKISSGGRTGTVVDAKLIFERALELKATAIVIAHNHPSNNPNPSIADRELTNKIYQAGETLDLPLLDHVIITDKGYYSFADQKELG